jgi:carboxyl-terminal processing protease
MGTRTFGKGSVQTVIPLRDGSAVRLTTAKYYTPANKTIQGEGIIPDVVVEKEKVVTQKENDIFDQIELMANRPKETRIEFNSEKQQYDSQLARAIDLLKGIKAYKGFLEAK